MVGSCSNGKCYCTLGGQICNNKCVSLENDPTNCGSCGHSCPVWLNMAQKCIKGICSN
jgi:hypothetical protein